MRTVERCVCAQYFHEFHEYWGLIMNNKTREMIYLYKGCYRIVLAKLTWLCPAYRQCLFTGECPFPEQVDRVARFLYIEGQFIR